MRFQKTTFPMMGQRKNIILLSLILGNLVEQPTPEVIIEQGTLRGRISTDGRMYEYLGIPYATVNESNRFQAPFPPPSWDGVFNAIDEHHVCLQMFGAVMPVLPLGQEDCLKINIYTPVNAANLPVMVYIHGGGFIEGSGNPLLYDGSNFVQKGVVVVTFNYRLGALGFLCLGLEGAPGNAGLKDQLAALRWIKTNIAHFGGDPDNVTIFGESAGAASVSHLKLTPLTDGLFHKAIVQSGTSLTTWAYSGDPINTAAMVAVQMGYFTKDPEELLKVYQNATLSTLMRLKRPLKKGSVELNVVAFMPCIEKEFAGKESIIAESPYEKLISGKFPHIPVMSGFNSVEGMALLALDNEKKIQDKDEVFEDSLPIDLDFHSDIERLNLAKTFKKVYFDNRSVSMDTIMNLAIYYTDFYVSVPFFIETEIISRSSKDHQYNYIFKYSGNRNLMKLVAGFHHEVGAAHADELFYMFKSNMIPQYFMTKDDKIIADRMTTLWTNFAKYGNPTPATSEVLPVKWVPSDSHELRVLYIDKEMNMGGVPYPERFRIWNETYSKFRRKFYTVGENTPEELLWI